MKALVICCALAGVAHADDPDQDAVESAGEKNLVSNAQRSGTTFSASLGAGITMGDGVGRGEAFSFRIGHVATPSTILTFEITGGSLFHQDVGLTMDGPVYHNDYIGLMAGGLHYIASSFWVRGAGGLASYTIDAQTDQSRVHFGISGLVGLGLDFVRWHIFTNTHVALGLETFSQMGIVASRGVMLNTGLCLGLSFSNIAQQPGSPGDVALWRTMSIAFFVLSLVIALAGTLSSLFEQAERRAEQARLTRRRKS